LRGLAMAIELLTLKHGEGEFFRLICPFALSKEVHKAMGEPLSSSDGMTWFLAVDGGDVIGFATVRETEDSHWFDYHYTIPERRGKGVQKKLDGQRKKYLAPLPTKPLRMACRSAHWAHWEAQGFTVANQRGDWFFGVKGAVEKAAKKRGAAK
jgi:hypothetical protein